ncbi:unnamed protein product, partial [Ectocarpus sp. 12 AP-2014]
MVHQKPPPTTARSLRRGELHTAVLNSIIICRWPGGTVDSVPGPLEENSRADAATQLRTLRLVRQLIDLDARPARKQFAEVKERVEKVAAELAADTRTDRYINRPRKRTPMPHASLGAGHHRITAYPRERADLTHFSSAFSLGNFDRYYS